jgi:reactive intermediate/imine deaminase
MAKKQVIGDPIVFSDGTPAPISQAVRAGEFLFVAGQLGVDENFTVIGDDIESQTRQTLKNLKQRLLDGGSTVANVVKVNAFLSHAEDFATFNNVYRESFPDAPPARTTVVSALLVPGARVEIECIAIID